MKVFDFVHCFRLNILTSKISNLLLPLQSEGAEGIGGRESYPANDISNKYIYYAFYCLLFIVAIPYCCFSLFGTLKELIRDSQGLQFRNFVRLEQKAQENISKNH